jgi:hypothetical protein
VSHEVGSDCRVSMCVHVGVSNIGEYCRGYSQVQYHKGGVAIRGVQAGLFTSLS